MLWDQDPAVKHQHDDCFLSVCSVLLIPACITELCHVFMKQSWNMLFKSLTSCMLNPFFSHHCVSSQAPGVQAERKFIAAVIRGKHPLVMPRALIACGMDMTSENWKNNVEATTNTSTPMRKSRKSFRRSSSSRYFSSERPIL